MKTEILVEAESFSSLGGWIVDPGAIHEMGSPYLMAHGMGVPVADAVTTVEVEEDGAYTVFVRTRDWTAPWQHIKNGLPGGRFQLLINGEALPHVLGTNGAAWDWQVAGRVSLTSGAVTVALHDLTGFNGRCDAICLSKSGVCPPKEGEPLENWRHEISGLTVVEDEREYDLIVCGGGMAGTCTALAAYRKDLSVALIQDRPVLGGCNSSEIRVGLGGMVQCPPYPRLGSLVTEIGPIFGSGATYEADYYEDGRKRRAFLPNILIDPDTRTEIFLHAPVPNLCLNESVIRVERDPMDAARITAVITKNIRTGVETRRRAKLFSDCSGDGFVARSMGCDYMYGREARSVWGEDMAPVEADRLVMGMSVLWYTEDGVANEPFPEVDFGIALNDDTCIDTDHGDWEWECGFRRDMLTETEYIRDYALMVVYANWSYLKHHAGTKEKYRNKKLAWVSPIGGKRESCRIVGDYVLTQKDAEAAFCSSDATAVSTWDLDQHMPEPKNDAHFEEPFRSCAYHRGTVNAFCIPYRCLYAKDVKNLFLGGRIISVSHAAFSSVRVMRTLGACGEAVGLAAAVCRRNNVDPRAVYTDHLHEFREELRKGVAIPQPHGYPPHGFETYHFKEIGNLNADEALRLPALKAQIDAMGLLRRYPDEHYFSAAWEDLKNHNGRYGVPQFPLVPEDDSQSE
ncbi:MAG: FAD-dependent oxidoreductase [Ruminococcaceae bacterium]|nr:FAD-dependent oxidoreductase [Oscillospiraceae bacterium]